MSQNTPRKSAQPARPSRSRTNPLDKLAKWINQKLEIDEKLSPASVKKVLWISGMVVIYIFFQHNLDGLIRKLHTTEKEVNEIRATYIYYKSKYLFASKQSEVEKKLETNGFERNADPPIKVSVKK